MVTIGHPDEDPGLSVRLPLEAVVHKNDYRFFSDDEIRGLCSEREETAWNRLSDELIAKLAENRIHSIPQGVAKRKFSKDAFGDASAATREILMKSKFKIC